MDLEKWKTFFCDAGIPEDKTATYASIFADNEIQADMLVDLNKDYLLDMGITVIGHVIAIIRYAKQKSSKAVIGEASASTTDTPSSESNTKQMDEKLDQLTAQITLLASSVHQLIHQLKEGDTKLSEYEALLFVKNTSQMIRQTLKNVSSLECFSTEILCIRNKPERDVPVLEKYRKFLSDRKIVEATDSRLGIPRNEAGHPVGKIKNLNMSILNVHLLRLERKHYISAEEVSAIERMAEYSIIKASIKKKKK